MLECLDGLRALTPLTALLRMLLAFVCGGLIGWERTAKRRPAGFRTHILICLGAMIATMTSQYIRTYTQHPIDMARLGAQVIAGVGFIGAGTIIVSHGERIKGLTTAAGLWTLAIVGLCIGAGYYELGLMCTAAILFIESVFVKWEHNMLNHSPNLYLYVEYGGQQALQTLIGLCRDKEIKIGSMELTQQADDEHNACLIIEIRLNKGMAIDALLLELRKIEYMYVVEQL